MRRLFVIGAGLLILGAFSMIMPFAALAQAPVPQSDAAVITVNPASKARIEIVNDNWDFGSIPKGSIVSHAYKIKNVGEDTLNIVKVKPTCGCTTAPLSSNSIAPGHEADLTANFNSEKFNGRVNKQINIDTTDPIKPYLKVIFTAIINNPLLTVTPEPAEVDFGNIKPGEKGHVKVIITNGENKSVKLQIVDQGKAINASLPVTSIPAQGKAELTLDLAPQGNQGELKESVTIEAVDLPNSRFTIPCKANIAM
jgi:hypothetical protein